VKLINQPQLTLTYFKRCLLYSHVPSLSRHEKWLLEICISIVCEVNMRL
jgi:hypothetical protein